MPTRKTNKAIVLPKVTDLPPIGEQSAYDEFIERYDDAIVIYQDGGFVGCNDAALKMLGFENADLLTGAHPADISPVTQPDGRDSREKADELISKAIEQGSLRFEWTHKTADDVPVPMEIVLTPMNIAGKQQIHAVCRDISEYKALQEQLRHVQKMEGMGKLAGGIAHDFNNFLVVVLGRAELLAYNLVDDEINLAHVKEIQLAGERGAALVRQLLTFGRKQPIERRVLDLREAVDEAQALLGPLLGEQIKLEIHHTHENLWVNTDLGQIEQILMNLASNARDAMPHGGVLSIRTDAVELQNDAFNPQGLSRPLRALQSSIPALAWPQIF